MGKALYNAKRSDMFYFDPLDLVLIDNPEHILYDPRVHEMADENLVLNIMYKGVLEPVIVTKDGDQAVVVAGRRRVKAAIEANKRLVKEGKQQIKVPCINRRGDNMDLFGVLISENEHRRDDGPLERAEKMNRFIQGGKTRKEACIIFGISESTVRNYEKLLDLDDSVKAQIKSGDISANQALELAELRRDQQATVIEKHAAGEAVELEKTTGRTRKFAHRRRTREYVKIMARFEEMNAQLTERERAIYRWVLRLDDDGQ
jgi:ParB family chromosome partitioning protein